jgi:hypothetical protein
MQRQDGEALPPGLERLDAQRNACIVVTPDVCLTSYLEVVLLQALSQTGSAPLAGPV